MRIMLRNVLKVIVTALLFNALIFAEVLTDHADYWNADQYEQSSDLQYRWAMSYLKKLQVQGNERILDVGCGDGRITTAIAKALPNGYVVGVDFSDSMLEKSLKNKKDSGLKNLFFEKRNAVQLDYENEFDLIVSFSCLHWVPDYFAALKGIEKALTPGGKVFLYFAPDYGRDRFDHAIDFVVNSPKWCDYFQDFSNSFVLVTPYKFMMLIEEVGLLFKHMEIITVDEVFSSKEAFMEWITGWMPHLKKLPLNMHEDFLENIIDCYLEKLPLDSAGNIHYIDYFMEVEAIKGSLHYKSNDLLN